MNAFKFLVVASLLFSANIAWAQSEPDVDVQCTQDADCPDSFTCETDGAECPPCREDGECPNCGQAWSYCQPPPPAQCADDADCSSGEVCVSYLFQECSGSSGAACGPDDDCDTDPEPEPSTCTSGTESYCVPAFVAPCAEAADCGGGFTCEDAEICSCSTSPGTPVDSDGGTSSSEDEPVDDCECRPSGDKYCQLVEVECATDSECAADLICQDVGGDMIAIGCAEGEDCDSQPPFDPTLRCAPSGYDTWGRGGGGADRVANGTNAEGAVETGERVSWGDSGSKASTDDGCSTTGSPSNLLPAFLVLGFFGLRRRKD